MNNQFLLDKRKVDVGVTPRIVNKKSSEIDLNLMKKEFKQLEDPPVTLWEKQISSSRFQYPFYNVPSKALARNLLGKSEPSL